METTWFDEFSSEGLIANIVRQLKSGKEATVFVCRAGAAINARFLAVKSFHRRLGRGFQNRSAYQHGRVRHICWPAMWIACAGTSTASACT